jgi:hypothetical protein
MRRIITATASGLVVFSAANLSAQVMYEPFD